MVFVIVFVVAEVGRSVGGVAAGRFRGLGQYRCRGGHVLGGGDFGGGVRFRVLVPRRVGGGVGGRVRGGVSLGHGGGYVVCRVSDRFRGYGFCRG